MSSFLTILQECKCFPIISFSSISKSPWKQIPTYVSALITPWKSKESTCSVKSSPSLFHLTTWQKPILFHSEFQNKSLTVTTPNFRCSNDYFILLFDCFTIYTLLVLVENWDYIIEESIALYVGTSFTSTYPSSLQPF